MIIHATRVSPFIGKCRPASLARTIIVSSTSGMSVVGQTASFSSMAPQNVHVPLHTYTPPSRMYLPPLQRSSRVNQKDGKIRNIKDFVDRIPAAVQLRKAANIEPGAFNDPVARLFR